MYRAGLARCDSKSPLCSVTNRYADRPQSPVPVAPPDPNRAQCAPPHPSSHHYSHPTTVVRVPGTAAETLRRCGRSTPPTGNAPVNVWVAWVVEFEFGTRLPARMRMHLRWACGGGHGAVPAWAGCLMMLSLYPALRTYLLPAGSPVTPTLLAAAVKVSWQFAAKVNLPHAVNDCQEQMLRY